VLKSAKQRLTQVIRLIFMSLGLGCLQKSIERTGQKKYDKCRIAWPSD